MGFGRSFFRWVYCHLSFTCNLGKSYPWIGHDRHHRGRSKKQPTRNDQISARKAIELPVPRISDQMEVLASLSKVIRLTAFVELNLPDTPFLPSLSSSRQESATNGRLTLWRQLATGKVKHVLSRVVSRSFEHVYWVTSTDQTSTDNFNFQAW